MRPRAVRITDRVMPQATGTQANGYLKQLVQSAWDNDILRRGTATTGCVGSIEIWNEPNSASGWNQTQTSGTADNKGMFGRMTSDLAAYIEFESLCRNRQTARFQFRYQSRRSRLHEWLSQSDYRRDRHRMGRLPWSYCSSSKPLIDTVVCGSILRGCCGPSKDARTLLRLIGASRSRHDIPSKR